MSGRDSPDKKISTELIFSNQKRILGFLNAVSTKCDTDKNTKITSKSREQLIDVMIMLKNIGIVRHITKKNESLYELSTCDGESNDIFPNVVNGELIMEDRCGRMSDLEFDEPTHRVRFLQH
jgi:LAGLIDADG-like domain